MSIQPGSTLLLVDDQPEMGLIVEHHCRRAGWSLAVSYDVPSAWERLQAQRFDLILLDMNLPRERGEKLCRRLRADSTLQAQPVALFSGWGLPNDLVAGLEAGADFVVSKELVRLFDDWVSRVGEILVQISGRSRPWFLLMKEEPIRPTLSRDAIGVIVRALRHTSLREIPLEVKTWIFRHAWMNALSIPVPSQLSSWLSAGVPAATARLQLSVEEVGALCGALANQIWCLLGTAASAPFRAALVGTGSGVCE